MLPGGAALKMARNCGRAETRRFSSGERGLAAGVAADAWLWARRPAAAARPVATHRQAGRDWPGRGRHRKLAEIFAWLRPGDLIWNYWVNNYLLDREPAAFDILFWNADTTRMTASLHRDFVRAAVVNALARPGAVTADGTEVDLAQVDLDCYVVAGVADHICPWESCYRSAQFSAARPGSCCPPAGTSPRWSTRRAPPPSPT
jgi:hypothetical protein